MSSQMATWETSRAWRAAQRGPTGLPLPAGSQAQETLLDHHRNTTSGFCLNDFGGLLHTLGRTTCKRSSFFLRLFALETRKSSGDSSDRTKIHTARDSIRDTSVNDCPSCRQTQRQRHPQCGMARLRVAEQFRCGETDVMTPLQFWKEAAWLPSNVLECPGELGKSEEVVHSC